MLDWCGKSAELFHDIQERYSFVGGAYEKYVSHVGRHDLPDDMWSFTSVEGVKADAGFSVVPKKKGVYQRKLLMQRSTNYAWNSGKDRSDFGLLGGTSLSSCRVPKDAWAVAVCDEGAAFTSIRTPSWTSAWSCCPPCSASLPHPRALKPLRHGLGLPALRAIGDGRHNLRAHRYVHQSPCHWAIVDSGQGLSWSAAATDD